ncbi:beta-ketoacyl synthase N-terminal-like domain-containing protein [Bacillus velezensis]|uniref:beta-ketoacyl synthase N-terminal-like domain-containing protein n=1 Tax=Bacillus velezensis TaxID=492670 RepID=UPI003856052A
MHPNEQSIKVNTGAVERNYVVKEIIKQEIAEILGISVAEVDYDEPFTDYGLDAYDLTVLHHNLEKKLKLEIPDNELVYHSTLNGLAEYLSSFEVKSLIPEKAEPEAKIDFPLEDLAFTLQVGRESMKERLAIIAGDVNDLKKGLSDYCNGKNDNPNLKQGNTNEFIEKFDILLNGEIAKKQMQKFLEDRDMEKIADLWVMGADVDWEKMYRGEVRQRMSLPTYPFDRKRHWILQVGKDHRLIPNKEIIKNDPDDSIVTKIQEETPVLERPYYLSTEDDAKLTDAILEYLKQMFSEVLNISTGYLSPHEEFESYGIDSIHINQLNRFFEQVFGTLPATLMFTYKNLYTLSKYFVEKQRGKIITLLNSLNDHQIAETGNVRPEKPVPFSKEAVPQTVAEEKISEDEQGVAIIGISGTFPQAENMDEFMRNLMKGKDSITEIPKERWDHRKYPDISCKWGGFVADADKFDPQFFNISPLNAAFMDPQERLFLQAVWSCLEDAGYTPESLGDRYDEDQRGNVAVYAGVTFNTYGLSGAAEIDRGNAVPINSQIYSVANRVSYLLNLRGPSLSVDTACSSSLYAIHLGCESILRDECDMAIAGGVNLTLHPSKYITLDSAKFLASDGHCRSFGKGGDGYVPGEGVGAVLLKPLWKAKRDRDHIYGVIKGSAVNHDGKTNGYSVPNPVAQKEVIKKALKKANVDPRTISYVEAHGTGTSLGDPIEITALTDAYAEYTSDKQFCSIGSVKSNIGHPEAAAGIAQVAKVLLQMKHKMLLPSRLNTEEINPDIQFAETPFYVQMKAEEWKQPTILNARKTKCPRRSGISSFGVGGVNVHMIIEEYEPERRPVEETQKNPVIIPLSAKNESALKRYATKLFHYLVDTKNQDQKVPDLRDIAFTLQTGRKAFPYRMAFIVSEYDELRKMVEKFLNEDVNGIKHIRGLIAGKAIPASKGIKPGDYSEVSAESDLYEMAAKWVEGNEIPFSELYKGFLPYRISLPVYPYEKEKYWMYRTPEKAVPFEEKLEMSISDKSASPCKEEEPLSNGSDMTFLYELANSFESEQIPKMIHYIQEIFASLLGFTEGRLPDPEQGFFELGLESIAIAEGYNMLQRVFNIELDEQVFFNYPNIVEVSKYILWMLNLDELEILSEPEDFCGLAETEEAAIDQNRTLFIDPVHGGEEDEALFNKIDQMSEEELIEMLEMEISEK